MSETLAKDWWQARKAGKHLPAHEIACDLPCPLCGSPLDLATERQEDGWVTVGHCGNCITVCDVELP